MFEKNEINASSIIGVIRWCVLGFVSIFALFGIFNYNSLVHLRANVQHEVSNIETMLQRKLEVLPDTVNTVESYMMHEEEIFKDISQAESELDKALGTGNMECISEANQNLLIALNGLKAVISRKYPELKSMELYQALIDEIEGSANRIKNARVKYNDAVAIYNESIQLFPKNIFAKLFGFKKYEEFKADEAAKNPNMVDFNK